MNTRERARIIGVKGPHIEDHGVLTTWVYLEFDHTGQGFGGLILNPELADSYVSELCAALGVRAMDELVGKECYALRAFSHWGESIEGLESVDTGRRFLHSAWRKRHFPETPSVLESRRASIQSHIASLQRDIERKVHELAQLDSEFVDWEKKVNR